MAENSKPNKKPTKTASKPKNKTISLDALNDDPSLINNLSKENVIRLHKLAEKSDTALAGNTRGLLNQLFNVHTGGTPAEISSEEVILSDTPKVKKTKAQKAAKKAAKVAKANKKAAREARREIESFSDPATVAGSNPTPTNQPDYLNDTPNPVQPNPIIEISHPENSDPEQNTPTPHTLPTDFAPATVPGAVTPPTVTEALAKADKRTSKRRSYVMGSDE